MEQIINVEIPVVETVNRNSTKHTKTKTTRKYVMYAVENLQYLINHIIINPINIK